MSHLAALCLGLSVLGIGASQSLAPTPITPSYQIVDLGPGEAKGINDHGDVVGRSALTGQACLWKGSRHAAVNIGSLWNRKRSASEAYAINNRGTIVGWSEAKGNQSLGFIYQHGKMHSLLLPTSYRAAAALGINNQNQVVGLLSTDRQDSAGRSIQRGCLWSSNHVREVLGYNSTAYAINGEGLVVGKADGVAAGYSLASQRNISLSHGYSMMVAVNEGGDAVGNVSADSNVFNPRHATLWKHSSDPVPFDSAKDLGTLPGDSGSLALAINTAGEIVGLSRQANFHFKDGEPVPLNSPDFNGTSTDPGNEYYSGIPGEHPHAVLWRDGKISDLNTLIPAQSGWTLQQATGINDKGQIVGIGIYHGKTHAFLLTPRK